MADHTMISIAADTAMHKLHFASLFRFGQVDALRLCVTETAIDAMSLGVLERIRPDTLYFSTGGGWSPATDMIATRRAISTNAIGTRCRFASRLPADGLTAELGHVDRRQIASLAGSAPHARQSGLFKGKRTIHGGRSHIRRAMDMAALVAIRWDQHWNTVYQAVREAGKAAKTAIIAVANAMVGLTYQV